MSHFPEERILTQHFLGALLITASMWTGPFLNSPGLELTTCTVTGVCLWNGDRIQKLLPSGSMNRHTELISK